MGEPHRAAVLGAAADPEDMELDGSQWRTSQTFDDGPALWEALCEHELEGVVAKRRSSRYLSGERLDQDEEPPTGVTRLSAKAR
jgi:ATP-dependent DNA ligase